MGWGEVILGWLGLLAFYVVGTWAASRCPWIWNEGVR